MNIDAELLTRAKVVAARGHKPLGAVIDDALRALLNERTAIVGSRPRVLLEADGGSGLQPGVDLENRGSLADLLGDNALPRAAG